MNKKIFIFIPAIFIVIFISVLIFACVIKTNSELQRKSVTAETDLTENTESYTEKWESTDKKINIIIDKAEGMKTHLDEFRGEIICNEKTYPIRATFLSNKIGQNYYEVDNEELSIIIDRDGKWLEKWLKNESSKGEPYDIALLKRLDVSKDDEAMILVDKVYADEFPYKEGDKIKLVRVDK